VVAICCHTRGAFTSPLPGKKLPDAILLDVFKVLNHAYSERSSVAFIDMTEPITWKVFVFIIALYLATQEQIACF